VGGRQFRDRAGKFGLVAQTERFVFGVDRDRNGVRELITLLVAGDQNPGVDGGRNAPTRQQA